MKKTRTGHEAKIGIRTEHRAGAMKNRPLNGAGGLLDGARGKGRFLALLLLLAGVFFSPLLMAKEAEKQSVVKQGAGSGPKVVLELFTSQGCSSCPRADALLPSFIARKDVIALSFSVDYWDYIGWRDTLARPSFTARQRAYGQRIGDGMIYTPEMVVDGRAHFNGSDRRAISAMIEKRKRARLGQPHIVLSITTQNNMWHVSVGDKADGMSVDQATLWMALFDRKKSVRVRRGENRGRYLSYYNVVREITPIGRWTGQKMVLKLPKKQIMERGVDGCVILLQNGDGGPILAAAEMPGG